MRIFTPVILMGLLVVVFTRLWLVGKFDPWSLFSYSIATATGQECPHCWFQSPGVFVVVSDFSQLIIIRQKILKKG